MPASKETSLSERLVASLLVLALAALPLTWVHIATIGGFKLNLAYVATLLLGLVLFCLLPKLPSRTWQLPGWCALILLPYFFYLMVLAISLAGLPDNGIVVRQVFFLLCGLTFGAALMVTGAAPRLLRRGALFAILSFLVISEVVARNNGLSWLIAIERLLLHGDLDFVVYGFLRELFRIAGPSGADAAASEKNIIAIALFTALVLFRAAHTAKKPDRIGQAMTLFIIAILLVLNTRSVVLVAVVTLPVTAFIAKLNQPRFNRTSLIVKTLVTVFAIACALLFLTSGGAAVSLFGDRFAFDDASTQGRLDQLAFALSRIEHAIWSGTGLQEINGQLVHNLFLGAWLHSGLLAFLLVASFYLAVLATWINFLITIARNGANFALPLRPEWVAMLPVLPLFRVWIGGDAGHPGFPEWIALFSFFTILLLNRLAQGNRTAWTTSQTLRAAH
ncbi:hypothetical protein NBRC116590_12180 [Pelagimonas sp. KU-00592-HH]|uniref:hypothetical protein n=1 Tax=Pelagimonas sp. KU-00592-HH TaxID=3127651 RepID=UPI0031061993